MKEVSIAILLVLALACSNKKEPNHQQEAKETITKTQKPVFQTILDEANVKGSILIF